ncbi:PIG-L family deacetylase [Candidatus Woesebacteria bacterium]|nr:PIG-L family deacetylase [Candidatus Woesebacteria bacterium]
MRKIAILSPHLDDAVLSLTDHILLWQKKGIDVTIITVFSSFSASKLTTDTSSYIQKSGFKTVKKFELARKKEDVTAMQLLKLHKKYIHLDFIDGGFREINLKPVYESYDELFSGKIRDDDSYLQKIDVTLQELLSGFSTIIAPIGIGNHADHIIVRNSAKIACRRKSLLFYADYPYALHKKNWSVKNCLYHLFTPKTTIDISSEKRRILAAYSSQIPILFQNTIEYEEIVYTHANL